MYGGIIGALLSVSFVLENFLMASGEMKLYMLLMVEFLAVAALHYYLLHRFTRERSQLYSAEEGFSFGQGYSYVLVISGFAGVLLGVAQGVYLHLIVGYSNYIDKYVAGLTKILSESGGATASMTPAITQMMEQIQSAPTPSMLLTVWNGIQISLLFGAFFGLIIAGVISRSPQPFAEEKNE